MQPRRHAALVACDTYEHLPPLRCPRNDAAAVRDVLTAPEVGDFGAPLELTSGESRDAALGRIEALFLEQAAAEDTVLFYFSGHGVIDDRGALRLALALADHGTLDTTTIALTELMGLADRSRSSNIIVMLDCCYAGVIGDVVPRPGANQPFAAVSSGQTMYVMTSSTAVQQSWEKEGDSMSVFTQFLVAGLQTGRADRDNDGLVTVDEAYAYARNLVSAGGQQDPLRFNYNVRQDLVLTRNPYFRPVDPRQVAPEQIGKFQAVRSMIDIVKAEEGTTALDEATIFGVVILGEYFVEGIPVGANMLTVSFDHTPNIVQTQTGFECDAFFPPELLSPEMKRGKEEFRGRYKVRMELRLDNMMFIVGKRGTEGEQFNLYTGG